MVRVAGLMGQEAAGFAVRSADGMTPAQALAGIRARITELTTRQARLWKRELQPALAAADVEIVAIEDCTDKELRAPRSPVPPGHLPGADAARRRLGSAVPVHLGPLALARRPGGRPGQRGGAVRPRQGARGPRSVRQHGQAARAPRVGDRALPAGALPRDGDLRAGTVPSHARRRLRGVRRRRRSPRGRRVRAQAPPLRRRDPRRGVGVGIRRRCWTGSGTASTRPTTRCTRSKGCSTSPT